MTYQSIENAPKTGQPVIVKVNGIETFAAYYDGQKLKGWFHYDENEEETTCIKIDPQPTEWKPYKPSLSDLIRNYVRAETSYHIALSEGRTGTVAMAQIDRARIAADTAFENMKKVMG